MLVFIARRMLLLIPTAVGVTLLVFAMLHLVPGDPARILAGEAANPAQVEQVRENLGLNDPFFVQYFRFLTRALQGDLGESIRTGRSVIDEIFEVRFLVTFQLALASTAFTIFLGLLIGIVSAMWKYSNTVLGGIADTALMILSLLGLSIPNFWLGILIMMFLGVQLGLLPLVGWGTFPQMVMPVLMLGLTGSAGIARLTRAGLIDVLKQDYIRTAYAKGISKRIVIFRHALRNALIPVITISGMQFGGMLAGAVITESIFAINGMGRLVVDSIRVQDFPVAQGTILIIATMFVLVNCGVDILYRVVNKRIELN